MNKVNHTISLEQREKLLAILQERFEKNMHRHRGLEWQNVQTRISASEKLGSLNEMEQTGGEPDVIGYDAQMGAYVFCDCSTETPHGRRNVCYDDMALKSRKEHAPKNSALGLAQAMGTQLLTEEEYHTLQTLGDFDTKTSSWIQTPDEIRALGGALFCDRRYGRVFVFHNGAESYYASRGFRTLLRI